MDAYDPAVLRSDGDPVPLTVFGGGRLSIFILAPHSSAGLFP